MQEQQLIEKIIIKNIYTKYYILYDYSTSFENVISYTVNVTLSIGCTTRLIERYSALGPFVVPRGDFLSLSLLLSATPNTYLNIIAKGLCNTPPIFLLIYITFVCLHSHLLHNF